MSVQKHHQQQNHNNFIAPNSFVKLFSHLQINCVFISCIDGHNVYDSTLIYMDGLYVPNALTASAVFVMHYNHTEDSCYSMLLFCNKTDYDFFCWLVFEDITVQRHIQYETLFKRHI